MRDWLGFGKGEGNVEAKLVTVVYGNDLVNTNFLNFQAMQEDIAKVTQQPSITRLLFATAVYCFSVVSVSQPFCQLKIIIEKKV